jgi:hypothetical protein
LYLGGRSSGNHVHHWRFDLQESHLIEELTNVGDDSGPGVKLLLDGHVVDDQILEKEKKRDNVMLCLRIFLIYQNYFGSNFNK